MYFKIIRAASAGIITLDISVLFEDQGVGGRSIIFLLCVKSVERAGGSGIITYIFEVCVGVRRPIP